MLQSFEKELIIALTDKNSILEQHIRTAMGNLNDIRGLFLEN
jgi:hypothetical protein